MKIRLLIATEDTDYAEHLSRVLTQQYMDTIEVNICSKVEHLSKILSTGDAEVGLFDVSMLGQLDAAKLSVALILWSDKDIIPEQYSSHQRIYKYQRISAIVSNVLTAYAKANPGRSSDISSASVTAVWSPAGGTGKTSVAIAYSARRSVDGKQVTYLDMENFSSTEVYFGEAGKSLSTVFECMESNVALSLRGIRQTDGSSGVSFYKKPDNYDDMNILTVDDVAALVMAAAQNTDELVVDMSSVCDEKTRKIMELADRVLIVTDCSKTSQAKLNQFLTQHDTFQRICDKTVLVCNKGGRTADSRITSVIKLPLVTSGEPAEIYKTLAANSFSV